MSPKYSVDGEIDAGWKSYWPPDEQPDDEPAEPGAAGNSESMSDTSNADNDTEAQQSGWDGKIPEYATEPDQGRITTEGNPMTERERERRAVREELAEAGRPDMLSDKQTDALAATRLNPKKNHNEVAEGEQFSQATAALAIRKYDAAMATTDAELEELIGGMSDLLQRATLAALYHPDKSSREIAGLLEISSATVRRADRLYADKFRGFGTDRFRAEAGIDSTETTSDQTEPTTSNPTTSSGSAGTATGVNLRQRVTDEEFRETVRSMDGPFLTSEIAEISSLANQTIRKRLNDLADEGAVSVDGRVGERGEKRWAVASDEPADDGDQEQPQESTSTESQAVDVGFRLGREIYHVLNDDGEACCNYADTSGGRESATFIRTVEADVTDEFDRCKQCARVVETDKKTRDELVQGIHDALDTGRESATFSKVELLRILETIEASAEADAVTDGGR